MLYLHDIKCKVLALSWWGTWLEDEQGRRRLCYNTGKAAESCIGKEPRPGPESCPGCDYGYRVYKCEGSCNMRFGKGGCE